MDHRVPVARLCAGEIEPAVKPAATVLVVWVERARPTGHCARATDAFTQARFFGFDQSEVGGVPRGGTWGAERGLGMGNRVSGFGNGRRWCVCRDRLHDVGSYPVAHGIALEWPRGHGEHGEKQHTELSTKLPRKNTESTKGDLGNEGEWLTGMDLPCVLSNCGSVI